MINTRNGTKGRKSGKTGFRPSCRMRAMPNACVIDAAHMDDAYRMDDPSGGDGDNIDGIFRFILGNVLKLHKKVGILYFGW